MSDLYVCSRDGRVERQSPGAPPVVFASAASWPTPRPGSDHIAVSIVEPTAGGIESRIELRSAQGEASVLYRSAPGSLPVIAPRVPHYCLWSPGGEYLAYVAQSPEGLALFITRPGSLVTASPIRTGAPIFSAWSADGSTLAAHVGTDLHLIDAATSETTTVSKAANGFRAPAWMDDYVYYAEVGEAGVTLQRASKDGRVDGAVARFDGAVAFAGLQGSSLALAVTYAPDSGMFNILYRLDLSTGSLSRVAVGPFVAFFAGSAGSRVALVTPTQSGDGRYALHVVDQEGHRLATAEGFYPSPDQRLMLGFFDQYALSHGPWSADGSRLVFCGRLPGDGVHSSMGDAANRVLGWNPVSGVPWSDGGPGEFAVHAE